MDITNDQIKEEFKRQVRLCAGIGYSVMIEIIKERFPESPSPQLSSIIQEMKERIKFIEDHRHRHDHVIPDRRFVTELSVLRNLLPKLEALTSQSYGNTAIIDEFEVDKQDKYWTEFWGIYTDPDGPNDYSDKYYIIPKHSSNNNSI